jgi:hypothetical protein
MTGHVMMCAAILDSADFRFCLIQTLAHASDVACDYDLCHILQTLGNKLLE